MTDEQSRDQLLSCLEDVKLDLEDIGQVSSAVMVAQAVEMIIEQGSRLDACEKLLAEVRFDRDAERARVIAAEGRLDSALRMLRPIHRGAPDFMQPDLMGVIVCVVRAGTVTARRQALQNPCHSDNSRNRCQKAGSIGRSPISHFSQLRTLL